MQPFADDHYDKRRCSDAPPDLLDTEESARLRWQAQSRNASFPATASNSAFPGNGPHFHPPPVTLPPASMSRKTRLMPGGRGIPTDYGRRPSTASRQSSVVGGQLARSFADLTANEGVSPQPDSRRPSMFAPPPIGGSPRILDAGHLDSVDFARMPGQPARLDRQSLTRPSTSDPAARPVPRRSSLTEIIMAKSGDDVAMATGRFRAAPAGGFPMNRPSLSAPLITGWPGPSGCAEPALSPEINLYSDEEYGSPSRGRKRTRNLGPNDNVEIRDPSMRGIEMLVDPARRVSEEDRKVANSEERDTSPGKAGAGGPPKYSCCHCAKTFSRPSSLRIHTYSRE